jgi:hypothetical protein
MPHPLDRRLSVAPMMDRPIYAGISNRCEAIGTVLNTPTGRGSALSPSCDRHAAPKRQADDQRRQFGAAMSRDASLHSPGAQAANASPLVAPRKWPTTFELQGGLRELEGRFASGKQPYSAAALNGKHRDGSRAFSEARSPVTPCCGGGGLSSNGHSRLPAAPNEALALKRGSISHYDGVSLGAEASKRILALVLNRGSAVRSMGEAIHAGL